MQIISVCPDKACEWWQETCISCTSTQNHPPGRRRDAPASTHRWV